MKPSSINETLDLALTVRKNGGIFVPCYTGAPGIAKSYQCKLWVENKRKTNPNFGFIDLRLAYKEGPDMNGYPDKTVRNGRQVMTYALPEFYPSEGEGLLLLEEPNRGTTSVMNTIMQILTDRKVEGYTLPEGWIIAAAINPETEHYDVNTMDAALKNRFQIFEVEYDKQDFISYMKSREFDRSIIDFVDTNLWQYKKPEQVGDKPGDKYVSPRTLEQLNNVVIAGLDRELEMVVYHAILGRNIGTSYYAFKNDEKPVLYKDLVESKKKALKRLEVFTNPDNTRNAQLSVTISDILDNVDIEDDLLKEVLMILPTDKGFGLVQELEYKKGDNTILHRLTGKNPDLLKKFKATLQSK